MKTLVLLPFQLHLKQPAFQRLEDEDVILLIEDLSFYRTHPFHKKRIVALMSAFRHHEKTLKALGFNVRFEQGDTKEILEGLSPDELLWIEATDADVKAWQASITDELNIPAFFSQDAQFILSEDDVKKRLPKRPYKMDPFYREMRKDFSVLMDEKKPYGGAWSFDKENRKKLPKNTDIPDPAWPEIDDMTRDVMALVDEAFADHPGTTEGFRQPVTHAEAEALASHFFDARLKTFGPYQDALTTQYKDVSHSMVSQALNTGLLDPMDLIRRAEKTLDAGVPINSVEGFIRQIIGWREYIRGIYLHEMPGYHDHNHYQHTRNLPHYYWDGDTKMNCLKDATNHVIDDGYAHHIQRLMVLGNFANLAGVDPKQVNDWFLEMFVDSHDWVVTPNVIGMALHADGGLMATKPYISSGSYIHKMGDYCDHCHYDVKKKTGPDACPFNALYWNFIDRHQETLAKNPRMGIPLSVFKKMDSDQVVELRKQAETILEHLESL